MKIKLGIKTIYIFRKNINMDKQLAVRDKNT